ncbi:hypothetical protein CSB45_08830 [candidate division KSB3 bacterium]|uniref:Uncharacterized protein n=1 Tax=candidate division KSB3 bacterium TaxID=2044937 RepID=A0A2G6E4M6_9BACT|nr:MAG: hypothetical protein CSB45_08830 [candidate division KSB3 bacterium]PIE29673.1 MAG: hypothetical protein CSA57_07600 [candidate division KSB3 bacterium]
MNKNGLKTDLKIMKSAKLVNRFFRQRADLKLMILLIRLLSAMIPDPEDRKPMYHDDAVEVSRIPATVSSYHSVKSGIGTRI